MNENYNLDNLFAAVNMAIREYNETAEREVRNLERNDKFI